MVRSVDASFQFNQYCYSVHIVLLLLLRILGAKELVYAGFEAPSGSHAYDTLRAGSDVDLCRYVALQLHLPINGVHAPLSRRELQPCLPEG